MAHRKTLRLARLLNLDRYAVVGRLVALWTWRLDNAPDGRLGVLGDDIDAEMLAEVMGWSAAMGTPDELLDTLIAVGFLDVDEEADEEAGESGQCVMRLRIHAGRNGVLSLATSQDGVEATETPAQAGFTVALAGTASRFQPSWQTSDMFRANGQPADFPRCQRCKQEAFRYPQL